MTPSSRLSLRSWSLVPKYLLNWTPSTSGILRTVMEQLLHSGVRKRNIHSPMQSRSFLLLLAVLDLKSVPGVVKKGQSENASCTFTVADQDMADLVRRPCGNCYSLTTTSTSQMTGKLKPTAAFMSGKLKVKGPLNQAQKLEVIFGNQSKLWSASRCFRILIMAFSLTAANYE